MGLEHRRLHQGPPALHATPTEEQEYVNAIAARGVSQPAEVDWYAKHPLSEVQMDEAMWQRNLAAAKPCRSE